MLWSKLLPLPLDLTCAMKKTFDGVVQAGDQLIRIAITAIREVRLAEASGVSKEEVARLQALADSAYEAAISYQCYAAGLGDITIH